jgi:hypothetical protein
VATTVEVLWQATGHVGPHRLHPFVPELPDRLTRDGDLTLAPEVEKLVRHVSPATLGRLLAPARAIRPPRGATTTRLALANEDSPVFVAPGQSVVASCFIDLDKVLEAFRGTGAFPWGAHHHRMFHGVEKFFRPGEHHPPRPLAHLRRTPFRSHGVRLT